MSDLDVEQEKVKTRVAILTFLHAILALLNALSILTQTILLMIFMPTCVNCHPNKFFPAFIPLNILSCLAIAHVLSCAVTCLQWRGLKWLQILSCIVIAYLWYFYWVSTDFPAWMRLTNLILAWVAFMSQFAGFGLAFYAERERTRQQILRSTRSISTNY
uniref:Transmembrane protein n=1 Tax=Acrobeloides nanus TaxID=290746 RepID=A0A914EFH3_9BILA